MHEPPKSHAGNPASRTAKEASISAVSAETTSSSSGTPSSPPGGWSILAVIAIVAGAWAAFGGSVDNDYVYDDRVIVRDNPRLTSLESIPEIFTTEYWNQADLRSRLYRPVTLMGFALDRAVFGADPSGSHGVNVALHALASVLLWLLALRLLRRAGCSNGAASWGAGAAGVLFAVHPVHSEAVLGLVGRAEVLVALFGLALLHVVLEVADGRARWAHRALLSPLVFLAAGSKESAVLLLPVIVLAILLLPEPPGRSVASAAGHAPTGGTSSDGTPNEGRAGEGRSGEGKSRDGALGNGGFRGSMGSRVRRLLAVCLWCAPGLVAYALLRSHALEGLDAAPVYFTDNPLVAVAPLDRIGTALAVVWRYVSLHFWPAGLSPDYSYNALALQSLGHPQPILGLLAVIALGAGVLWSMRTSLEPVRVARVWAFALAWFAIGLFALSNLVVVLSTIFGERLIYFPGIGLFLAWAVAMARAIDGSRKPVAGNDVVLADRARSGAAAVAVVLSALSILGLGAFVIGSRAQTEVWESNATLFSYAVTAQPESFRVWDAHGRALMESGDLAAAEAAFRRSASIWPQFDRTQSSLLSIYLDTGRADSALVTADRLLALDPTHEKACFAKAQHALEGGDAETAMKWAEQGLASAPDYAPLHFIVGQVRESRGEWEAALRSYDVMLRSQPALTNLKVRMAALLVQAGRWDRAISFYRELAPQFRDWSLDNGLAWSLLQRGRTGERTAEERERDLEEALLAADRAVERAPAEMARYPRDTRAEILWDLGRHDDARAAFRALAAEFPSEPAYQQKVAR